MKQKTLLILLLLLMAVCLAGCGNKAYDEASDGVPDISASDNMDGNADTSAEETAPHKEQSAKNGGVFSNGTELTEIDMGVTENICSVTIPLDYVLVGGYYDEDGNEHAIDGLNSATTVREAMEAGDFPTKERIAAFTATSVDGDTTMITATMYLPGVMSWADFKATYPEAGEIGTADVPALYYHVEAFSGKSLAVAVRVTDMITLSIVYEGALEKQLGAAALAQELYNLVTVK